MDRPCVWNFALIQFLENQLSAKNSEKMIFGPHKTYCSAWMDGWRPGTTPARFWSWKGAVPVILVEMWIYCYVCTVYVQPDFYNNTSTKLTEWFRFQRHHILLLASCWNQRCGRHRFFAFSRHLEWGGPSRKVSIMSGIKFLQKNWVSQINFWKYSKVFENCKDTMTLFSYFWKNNEWCLKMKNNANNVNFEDIDVK